MNETEVTELFDECEKWHKEGFLVEDSKLRTFIRSFDLDDNVNTLALISSYIYRYYALKYFASKYQQVIEF